MTKTLSALVVDDEPAVRQLTVAALVQRGFTCEQAEDGEQGLELARRKPFDVIVTDLRMPQRHGHSLADEVLSRLTPKPIVVVLTGVAEPRLALDLLDRGVDDIVLKPVDFRVLAAKVHAHCNRRLSQSEKVTLGGAGIDVRPDMIKTNSMFEELLAIDDNSRRSIEMANALRRERWEAATTLKALSELSEIGNEVRRTTRWLQFALTKERPSDDVDVVSGINSSVVADLTIFAMLRRLLRGGRIRWVDEQAIYRCSSWAAIVLCQVIPREQLHRNIDLLLATMLSPLLRPLAGIVSRDLYSSLVRECASTGVSLASLEKRLGIPSPITILKASLIQWGISPAVIELLEYATLSYRELHALNPSLRSDIKRIKIASLLGQIAQGYFAPWDELDIPSMTLALRLGFRQPSELLRSIREKYSPLVNSDGVMASDGDVPALERPVLSYERLSCHTDSLFELVIQAQGYSFVQPSRSGESLRAPGVLNGIDTRPDRVRQFLTHRGMNPQITLICNESPLAEMESHCSLIQLPCSAAALKRQLNCIVAESLV